MDATSFERKQGRRQVKTDRVDLGKLLRMLVEIALWQFLETGVVPEGAELQV